MSYSDLLLWQYRTKPKAISTIRLIEREITQGFIDLYRLQDVLNIETSKGHQLDLVGKHVGQFRTVDNYSLHKFFGFLGFPLSLGFSVRGKGGGEWYRYRSPLKGSVLLKDDDYRFLIKCRILKNYQSGTLPDLIQACRFIFGNRFRISDNGNMTVTIFLNNEDLSPFKHFAINHLDILPRGCGVAIHFTINEENHEHSSETR